MTTWPRSGPSPQDAVIFDLDGVVVDTARVHAAAWKRLFDAVLTDPRIGGGALTIIPFDVRGDYRQYVDGRSREDGVASFLASRGITPPRGTRQDPPDAWTVYGLSARKNEIYRGLLAERGVRVFVGTAELLRRLRAGGVPVALVTASRNADELLASAA